MAEPSQLTVRAHSENPASVGIETGRCRRDGVAQMAKRQNDDVVETFWTASSRFLNRKAP